ncbi:MAG: Gfo/Idh/MocA family oxidoreductase [Pseudomonadota bacterium]
MQDDLMSSEAEAPSLAQDVRVAVVGCGGWGKNLVRNFAELGVLEAIVEPSDETASALAKDYGGRVLELDAALSDPDVDAVVIAAPAVHHYELAKKALEAGKHTYVEKPLALESAQADELCALAERLDRRLMVGHLLQYHPAFLKLKDLVQAGALGRLQYVYSNRLNLGKIRREEDIMWSFAPHDISMILSLIGAEPNTVDAVGSYHLHDSIADVTMMHLGFPNGERAHVFVSWLHPFKEQKLVVVGDEAMAVFNDGEAWDRKLLIYPHKVAWKGNIPTPNKADEKPVPLDEAEPLKLECQHFLDCVKTGATPRTDGREGARVLSVLTAASRELKKVREKDVEGDGGATAPRVSGEHPGVMIHESAYVDEGVTIGEGTRIWHFSHVLGNVSIGKGCSIGQNVVIGPKVTVGDNVKIQNNVSVYEGVTLEDGVFCGPSCVFTNVNNPRSEIERKDEFLQTPVKRGVTIGANATIVCGHTLGEYCFIAAGAVVTNDVPAYALMAGVPAKRIGWMSRAGAKLGPDLVCPLDGTRYKELGDDHLALENG